jgi:hypothetical protein
MRTFRVSFSLAPSLYPSITFSGGASILVLLSRYRLPVEPTPATTSVLVTSIDSNSIEDSVKETSFGGIM